MARSDLAPISLVGGTALLGLLPLAMAQRALFARTARRCPAPPGAQTGWSGPLDATALNLLVAGEASAVGVGASSADRALAPRLALGLGLRLQCTIRWQTAGGNGWTASRLSRSLRSAAAPDTAVVPDPLERPDIAVVLLGGADTLALTGTDRWRRNLRRLHGCLLDRGARVIMFCAVPPVAQMPAVPWPLSTLLEQRAAHLDRVLQDLVFSTPLAPDRTVTHLPLPDQDMRPLLSADGIHPSDSGQAHWAAWLSRAILREWRMLPVTVPTAGQQVQPARG